MVADFWGVETRGAGLRARAASTDYGAGLIQDGAHVTLKSMGREDGLIIYHEVMLKVQLESGRFHSVLIEGLRRNSSESQSLFSGESKWHAVRTGA